MGWRSGGLAATVLIGAIAIARADSTPPAPPAPPAPACHDATHRAIERAFADYCRTHPGSGVHGSCAEWLRAYRRCQSTELERAPDDNGWLVVVKLFACHEPILAVVPEGKRWRVREVTMRSLMPRMPTPVELLDLSRIRSGAGLALVRTRVDLGELAREVADEARVGTPDALIAVRVLGDAAGEWDRDRLAQVVANLLSNAIQHGRRGAPVGITVDGERDARAVRLEVVNEGDPIPEADRATLFEPWKRGAGTRDRRTGAGLGLYIVHGVVTAHGGSVAVESDLLGTRVCLSLPR